MNKIFLLTGLSLFLSLTGVAAQTAADRDTMYVCQKSGQVISFAIEDVDSIVFDKPSPEEKPVQPMAVDLGLSVKWADMNVGATTPEEPGGFYAWGETEEKDTYSQSTYLYYNDNDGYQSLGRDIAGTEYDVAHVKWGGDWRMPTLSEWLELEKNCTWTWTTQNDVNGYLVTGTNGNSIFLPAAGDKARDKYYYWNRYGYYWVSTFYNGTDSFAPFLFMGETQHYTYALDRWYGRSVRAVCP